MPYSVKEPVIYPCRVSEQVLTKTFFLYLHAVIRFITAERPVLYIRWKCRSKSDRPTGTNSEGTAEEHLKHDSGLCFVQLISIKNDCTHNIFFLLLVSDSDFKRVWEFHHKPILYCVSQYKIYACDLLRRSIFSWYRSQIMQMIF